MGATVESKIMEWRPVNWRFLFAPLYLSDLGDRRRQHALPLPFQTQQAFLTSADLKTPGAPPCDSNASPTKAGGRLGRISRPGGMPAHSGWTRSSPTRSIRRLRVTGQRQRVWSPGGPGSTFHGQIWLGAEPIGLGLGSSGNTIRARTDGLAVAGQS